MDSGSAFVNTDVVQAAHEDPMRMTSPLVVVVVFVASLGLSVAHVGAQTAAPLTIHNVTVQERTGVLTITGTGFGRTPAATVDGEPVTVLANGTDTRIEVLAPAALLVTPGTYRLTVVDPARHSSAS